MWYYRRYRDHQMDRYIYNYTFIICWKWKATNWIKVLFLQIKLVLLFIFISSFCYFDEGADLSYLHNLYIIISPLYFIYLVAIYLYICCVYMVHYKTQRYYTLPYIQNKVCGWNLLLKYWLKLMSFRLNFKINCFVIGSNSDTEKNAWSYYVFCRI